MNESDNNHRTLLICLFLTVITLAVFLQVKDYAFVNYDDNEYVTENPHVTTGLTLENVAWAFTTYHNSYWHPLTWISHMLDCQLFGLKPGLHHLVNLFFHIANTLLLFLIFRRMTNTLWQSAFVAAAFAIHPMHVESVAWIAERKDVLSTFFWMLTMGAYVFYIEKRELKRYLFALFFFVLGLMTKPMLVTLPFVLLLLDYWPLRRIRPEQLPVNNQLKSEKAMSFRKMKRGRQKNIKKTENSRRVEKKTCQTPAIFQIVLEKVPFFTLSLASSIVTYLDQQKVGAMGSLQSYPMPTRIANALVSYWGYIWKMIWPDGLAVIYPYPGTLPPWRILGAAFLLGIITTFIIWTKKRYPYLATGWFWYLGTLVPVIGLVQVGAQAMADRYTYVPLIGLFIMIAWGIPDMLKTWRFQKVSLALFAGIVLAVFTFSTWKNLHYWQNSLTLFGHALDVTSDNYIAHSNLGHALKYEGKLDEAIFHYSESVRIYPNGTTEHNNLGVALQEEGRIGEAIAHYLEAIRINPDYSEANINLAGALASIGKYSDAMTIYSKLLQNKPDSVEVHYNMGTMLASQGNIDGAIYHFRECIRVKPDYAKAYNNLGSALLLQGKIDEAIGSYREALRLRPDYTIAQRNLDDALVQERKKR